MNTLQAILLLLSGLFSFQCSLAQDQLQAIEEKFSRSGRAIADSIGGSPITNEFELYGKATSRTFHNFEMKIDSSNCSINSLVDYYKGRIKDSIMFNSVHFMSGLDFSLARCAGFISIHQCQIDGKSLFLWSQFNSGCVFSRSKFSGDAVFQHAVFNNATDFFQSDFNGIADFYGSQFNGISNFGNSSFFNESNFSFSSFNNECSFTNTEFGKACLFNNCEINATLDFSGAKFDSIADFSCCRLKGSIVFNNCVLPAKMDLSGIESISTVIDLTQIKSNEKQQRCRINLIDTDISKIKMLYENFELWFPDHTSFETKCKVYEGLLASLDGFGFKASYKKLDIEYQQLKYIHNNQCIKNKFQEIWWNYGYNKEAIFMWLFRIVLLLTLINTLLIKSLLGSVYEMKYLNLLRINEYYKLHHPVLAFFLSMPTGFLYTVILLVGGAFGIKFSSDQIRFPSFIGMLYIISVGLLGISCSAFVIKFIFDL
ncbi:MAG: Uncharacterized protein JWO09_779 [Bacteroidetes bacterium]|nr:Uncharacterized protein [Bacteroidota bacterium]